MDNFMRYTKAHTLDFQPPPALTRDDVLAEIGGDLYRERVGSGLCICCGESEEHCRYGVDESVDADDIPSSAYDEDYGDDSIDGDRWNL